MVISTNSDTKEQRSGASNFSPLDSPEIHVDTSDLEIIENDEIEPMNVPEPVGVLVLQPGESGYIESLELVLDTGHSQYFEMVYLSDGLKVTGYLGFPTDGGPFPAIIYNRGGGLEFGSLQGWEIVPYVEAGFVGVASNYRGNSGSEGKETYGGDDINDVLNLIPLLKSLSYVDSNRIGMVGQSHGGMMTCIALKELNLRGDNDIKAAVVKSGVYDLFMWLEERP